MKRFQSAQFSRLAVDENGRKILSETYCGSAAYAAPEILKGTKYNPKVRTAFLSYMGTKVKICQLFSIAI